MLRSVALALFGCLLLTGCGPNKPECLAAHPDFDLVVRFAGGPLPSDTVIHVAYGGSGIEDFNLAAPGKPEVVFCEPADAEGNRLDASFPQGAAGEGNSDPVQALACALWTGGYSKVEVRATGVTTVIRELSPREHVCTVKDEIELEAFEAPDAG